MKKMLFRDMSTFGPPGEFCYVFCSGRGLPVGRKVIFSTFFGWAGIVSVVLNAYY